MRHNSNSVRITSWIVKALNATNRAKSMFGLMSIVRISRYHVFPFNQSKVAFRHDEMVILFENANGTAVKNRENTD